jgi:hypothetical protein
VILQNVAAVHSAGGFHYALCLNGRYFDVKVQCPIAVIIGDAKRNNSLCAHFNSSQSKQLCCECDTMFEETDNPYSLCHHVTQQKVQEMVMGGDSKGIEGLSFHNIKNAFWNISFGANGYGIYQHCPPENVHSIKEGLSTYLLKGLVDQLSGKQKALAELDSLFQEISKHCKHQSDCNFPCMSFPFGF